MDTAKLQAALIRAFYTFVFPLIGALIDWLLKSGNLESIGITDGLLIIGISAALYGLKKYLFPDTKF